MARVVDWSTFKNRQSAKCLRQETEGGGDLTEMLKTASALRQEIKEIEATIMVVDFGKFKRLLESRLADLILKTRNIGVNFFLCGTYIAALLAETGRSVPESWFAIDYFMKNDGGKNPTAIKQGANICFLICTVFPERSRIRAMNYADYEAMGRGLYYNYYGQTGKIIAYFMSKEFQPLAEITKECLSKLK